MKALIDTNIILDFFLDRAPFVTEATTIWKAAEQGKFEGYVSSITPINRFYIGKKLKGRDESLQAIGKILKIFGICPADHSVLQSALALGFSDYEDAVQHACATAAGLDAIVTRDLKDYRAATLTVYAPADSLSLLP